MKLIAFRYKDQYSMGNWSYQEGVFEKLSDCISWYGLDEPDIQYEIISIQDVKE